MKQLLLVFIILAVLIFIISLFGQEFTYVGAAKCKICHKKEKQGQQYPIWEESKHSQSYTALTSETALETAKKMGLETPPKENPKCLKCHTPLCEKAPEFKEEGITCEVCHGPGSAYKKLSVMKSREKAMENGLIVYESVEAIEKQCSTCHEMAHQKPFDFKSAWEKIKHPIPEEK